MENFWEMRFFELPFLDCYERRVKNIASMCRKRLTEKKCWQNPGFRCWTFMGCSPPFHYMVHLVHYMVQLVHYMVHLALYGVM